MLTISRRAGVPCASMVAPALLWLAVSLTHATPADSAAPMDSSEHIAARIVASKLPVLVDFWAHWCGPCKMLKPTLEQVEKEYKGKVLFVVVDIDRHRRIAQYFGVTTIPAVFVVKDRVVRKALSGLQAKADYEQALNEILAPPPSDSASSTAPAPPNPAPKQTQPERSKT